MRQLIANIPTGRRVVHALLILLVSAFIGVSKYFLDYEVLMESVWKSVLVGGLGGVYVAFILAWFEVLFQPWEDEWEAELQTMQINWNRSPGYKTKFQSDYVQSQDEKESDE